VSQTSPADLPDAGKPAGERDSAEPSSPSAQPRVSAVVRRLDELDRLPVHDHVALYAELGEELQAVLADGPADGATGAHPEHSTEGRFDEPAV
jgi:hypothetical protein